MSNIFISYNRQSEAIARMLVSDIESLGFTVWFDQDLSGGQAWWDQILAKIRDCDVLVFLMDAHSLDSTACKREFGYAADLGKPILPILASDEVSTTLLPPELSQLNYIDYKNQDRKTMASLAKALINLPPAKPLPDPLPPPPEIPVSYLGGLTRKVEKPSLNFKEQSTLLVELKRSFKEAGAEEDTRKLLKKLRSRRDIYAAIADEIDDLIGKPEKTSSVSTVQNVPESYPKVETSEEPELTLLAAEPEIIPAVETPPHIDALAPPAETHKITRHMRWKGAIIGAGIGVVLGIMFVFIPLGDVSEGPAAICFGIAGAITGAICGNQRKAIIIAFVGAFAVFTLWALLDHTEIYRSLEGRTEYFTLYRAIYFGLPIGAILGAIIGSKIKRFKV